MSALPSTDARARSLAIASLMALAAVFAIAIARSGPPEPVAADAPAERFSAERAVAVLARILGDELPHPTGSAENDAVRARLIAELEAVGLEPRVQTSDTCTPWATCMRLHNVVARIDGSEAGPGLLFVSHYDTQPHTPGAGDDGSGIAVAIETARALRGIRPRRSLIFLFSDGEETGLAGAYAFAREHPWQADVGAVLNFEARGSRGASLMFETGAASSRWVERWANSCPNPRGSSLFASIYERMPNDTDFSVWKQLGYPGLNFAFTGAVSHYHTRLDDLAHLDRGSVQHHGDCALALVRSVAADGLPDTAHEPRVYFDVLGAGVVSWPAALAPILLAVCVAALAATAWRSGLAWRPFGWALAGWLAAIAAGLIGVSALSWLLVSGSGSKAPWSASPVAAMIAFSGIGLGALLAVATRVAKWVGALPFATAYASWTLLFAAVSNFALVEASYLYILPAIAIIAALAVDGARPGPASLLAAAACALVYVPTVLLTIEALGFALAPAIALPLGFAAIGFAPLLALDASLGRRAPTALGFAGIAASLVILASPPYTAEHPAGLNLLLLQEGDTPPRWIVSGDAAAASQELIERAELRAIAAPGPLGFALSWGRATLTGPSKLAAVAPPTVEWLPSDSATRLSFRVRSQRGARTVGFALPKTARPTRIRMNGVDALPIRAARMERAGGIWMLRWLTTEADGARVDVELEVAPEWLEVFDLSSALPASTAVEEVRRARGSAAVAVHQGDSWVVARRVPLPRPNR